MSELLRCGFTAASLECGTETRPALLKSLEPSFLSQKMELSRQRLPDVLTELLRHCTEWKPFAGARRLNDVRELPGCSLPLSEGFAFFARWPSVQTHFLVLRFLCIVCLGAVARTERLSSGVTARHRNAYEKKCFKKWVWSGCLSSKRKSGLREYQSLLLREGLPHWCVQARSS